MDHMPSFPFTDNDNVMAYSPPLNLLIPSGTHSTALLFCALDPGLKFQDTPEATQVISLGNVEECLANPFPLTNPPVSVEDLTVVEFKDLQLIIVGLDQLLEQGAFETLTELFIENFFNTFGSDFGVSEVEAEITVTDVLTPGQQTRDRLLQEATQITVIFDMTLSYLEGEKPTDPNQLAAAAFLTNEQRESFVQAMIDSDEPSFRTVKGVSALEFPESGAVAMSFGFTILLLIATTAIFLY